MGTFTATQSKYYGDKVLDPISGAHYDADTGEALDTDVEPIETEEVNQLQQVIYNITWLVILTVSGIAIVYSNPGAYLITLGVTNFLAGIAMPILRTVEFAEDDSTDVALALALILILGPFVGGLLYAFICMVRSEAVPSMVGVFISYLVLRIALDAAAGIPFNKIMPWNEFTLTTVAAQLMPIAAIAGWLAAFPFHQPDES